LYGFGRNKLVIQNHCMIRILCQPNYRWGTQPKKHYLCASDVDTSLGNWKKRLHEFSTRMCARIDCGVRWVGKKIREPPSFYGSNDLEEFLTNIEEEVLENHRLLALDIALKETPSRWWGAHKETIHD
jgi:hypothetical protein